MSTPSSLKSFDRILVDLAALRDRSELGAWLTGTLAERPDVLWAALWERTDGRTPWQVWSRAGTAVVRPEIDRSGLPLGAYALTEGEDAGRTFWRNDLDGDGLEWARMPGVRGLAFQPIFAPQPDGDGPSGRVDALLAILASVAFVGEGVAWLKTLAAHLTRAIERARFIEAAGRPDDPRGFLTERQMREFERRNLQAALEASEGKIYGDDGAAARMGLRPTTLASRLGKFKVSRNA